MTAVASLSDRLLAAYLRGMLFASTEPDGTPLDRNHETRDIDPETRDILRTDVERFVDELPADLLELVRADADRAGVDLWLTANGHGAGFWDGDWSEAGDRLTEIAKRTVKPRDPYPGDDQRIHV